MKSKNIIGHITSFLTIFIWGTTFISTKVLLQDFTPVEILMIRFLMGYIALWLVFPHHLKVINPKQNIYFAAAGLCGITLYYLFENIALTYTLASNVGIIVSISPFVTAIFSCIFLKDKRPGIRFIIGFLIAMTGICLISLNGSKSFAISPIGNILAILASIIWAAYSTLVKKISTFGYHIIQTTRLTFFYGILFMLPCCFVLDFNLHVSQFMSITNFFNLLFLGLGASAICFVTWSFSVKTLGVVKTSVYIYMIPVISVIASVLILREPVTLVSVFGISLILLGLFLSESSKKETAPNSPQTSW
ncbi:drug/metabolite transporter (DMT)-like permease [Lachnotalea glycerini]|uniref:Drug/metabolite transporter (DMT)-like permease n=1 Tax=Lachnotalea glycerini TaxID=1763509 RepID=A0A318EJS5_9FIRM|nr:DMT family transporter [Lachnotalea glycerini]PXV86313.1 drug/metabolite transporter (DMT)-like permease [Lachnotalea glycerini]